MSVHRAKAGTRSSFRNAHSYSKTAAIAHPKPWSTLREVYALLNGINRSSTVDEEEVFQHVRFHEKQRVFTVGQPFEMLYIVNGGFLKTVMFDRSGHEQVLSFLMKGDLFGVD